LPQWKFTNALKRKAAQGSTVDTFLPGLVSFGLKWAKAHRGSQSMSALPAHEPAKHPSSSFAKSLFRGEIHTDMVLPFPAMEQAERKKVSDLISSLRDVVDDLYDPVKASENGWVGDDLIAGLGERGLLGLYVGEQYGGQGL